MGNVREIRRLWLNAQSDFQGLLNTQMRRVRFVAQCIYDQNLYERYKIDNCIRNTAAIAEVSDEFFSAARQEIAVYDSILVRHGYMRELHSAEHKRTS